MAQNINRFDADSGENKGEVYGVIEADETGVTRAYIIGTVMRAALGAEGISWKPVVTWLESNDLIKRDSEGNSTIQKRIKKSKPRCYALKIPDDRDTVDPSEMIW